MIEQITYKLPERVEQVRKILREGKSVAKGVEERHDGEVLVLQVGTRVQAYAEASIPNGAEFIPLGAVNLTQDTEVAVISEGLSSMQLGSSMMSFSLYSKERKTALSGVERAVRNYDMAAWAGSGTELSKIDSDLATAFIERELAQSIIPEGVKRVVITTPTAMPAGR